MYVLDKGAKKMFNKLYPIPDLQTELFYITDYIQNSP